ncbi:MAG: hypothetical protein R3194_14585, partial [Limnobacter sp.]|nr:hypothetical protein [Limnobacter sp.]
MSSLPLPPPALSRQKEFWLKKLYRLTTFKTGDLNHLAAIRRQADYFCTLMMFFGLLCTLILGVYFNLETQAFLLGVSLFSISVLVAVLGEGKPASMYLQGAVMALLAASQVHLAQGMPELHFGFFMVMAILMVYRKPQVILGTGILIIGLHWVMNNLQQEGLPVYIFKDTLTGLGATLLHSFYIICAMGIFSFIAQVLRKQAKEAEETARMLSYFGRANGVDFRMRA